MGNSVGQARGRTTQHNEKPKFSSKLIPITVGLLALCWFLFIISHIPRKVLFKEYDKSTINHKLGAVDIQKSSGSIEPIVKGVVMPYTVVKDTNLSSISPKIVGNSKGVIHVVFSTDCSFYQDWQTLLIFHSAIAVGQKGQITRIASGCSEEKKAKLSALYLKLFPDYHVHYTPDYKKDTKTKKEYDFYNKPYGVEHWLDHTTYDDDIAVAIIDPDMIFVRPLTVNIREEASIFLPESHSIPAVVSKGVPAAQLYGLGAPWATPTSKNFNRTNVCGEGSPCLKTTTTFGEAHYSVGPPYILDRSDLRRLTKSWVAFVPRVYERYPNLLAEMFAYSMAAAHEALPHFTVMHYMVSNTDVDEEGWRWIDALGDDVCNPPISSNIKEARTGIQKSTYYPHKRMPTFVHYCQFFRAGEIGFHKRRLKNRILGCDFPLLLDPPNDLGKVKYKNRDGEIVKLSPKQARRNSFSLCVIHRSINLMLIYYKQRMCPPGTFVNTTKSINVIHWPNGL